MNHMYRIVLLLFTTAILFGKAIAQPVPTTDFPFKMTVDQYIEKYSQIAVDEMHRSRIPASITLAQGLIESGNGNSRLALLGNNHFGIKCKKDWTGDTVKIDDDAPEECFRKYNSPLESYKDHSEFLMKGTRYAFLFDLETTDYKSWAKGLKKAGYATNPKYAEILIGVIERNNLQRFDLMKPTEQEVKKIAEEKKEIVLAEQKLVINGVPAIIVRDNESFASIALANDMRIWQLYKYNDLQKDATLKTGDTIYIKPKNYKAQWDSIVMSENESLHQLSQRYAIKLSQLYTLNRIKEGQKILAGEYVYLKNKRPLQPKLVTDAPVVEADTLIDNSVYEDAKKNVETSGPQLPHDPFDLEAHQIKEQMAFIHVVQPGETIFGIAKRYNVQVEGIKALNKLKSDVIKTNDRLIINPNQPPVNRNEESVIPGYHTVVQGETLYSIGRLYGTTVEMLKALNDLQTDQINIGDELVVIARNGEVAGEKKPTDDSDPVYYNVKEGDTVYSLSRKFNLEQSEFRQLNNMIDNAIMVGQRVRVR